MFVLLLFCVLLQIATITAECLSDSDLFDNFPKQRCSSCSLTTFTFCQRWSSCSQSCGGGTRSRLCKSNLCNLYQNETVYEDCNEKCLYGHSFQYGRCQCPSWRTGKCCEACQGVYIPHCVSGQQSCGGSPDGIKCTQCEDPYYSAGYNKGCRACSTIDYCQSRYCTNSSNTLCSKCENTTAIYRLSTDRKTCIHDIANSIDDYTGILVATFVLLAMVCILVPAIYASITRRWCFKTPSRSSIHGHKISVIPNHTVQTLDY